jgi:hypothetical protein
VRHGDGRAAKLRHRTSRWFETRMLGGEGGKMKICEYSRFISDCVAGGGGAAAGIYRVGAGGGKRAGDTGSVADAFFSWTEAGGVDCAGRARFAGRYVWVVFAGGNCCECGVLLCDFCSARVFGYSPPHGFVTRNTSLRSLGRAEARPYNTLATLAAMRYRTRRTAPPAAGRRKWLCHLQALAFSLARERRDCV